MPLFNRRAVLQVEGRDLSALRITFDVSKNLKGRPNKAEISVTNLSPDTRRQLSAAAEKRIVLLAGYETETPYAVFVGTLEKVEHARAGSDWVSKITSGDGLPRSARVSAAFGRGADLERVFLDVVKQAAAQAGLGSGNASQVAKRLKGRSVGAAGVALSGAADVALDGLLEELGLEWSVQDQQLQILERGKPRQVRAAVISPDSGLVGSPEVLEKGRVRAKSLLAPGLDPGLLVRLESRDLQGFYRVDSARYTGDARGQDWYVQMEMRPAT